MLLLCLGTAIQALPIIAVQLYTIEEIENSMVSVE